MMDHAAILAAIVDGLLLDTEVARAVQNRVWNHPPQNAPLPYLQVRWNPGQADDSKSDEGWDGEVIINAYHPAEGDAEALRLAKAAGEALFASGAQIPGAYLIAHRSLSVSTEPNGVAHRAELRCRLLVSR